MEHINSQWMANIPHPLLFDFGPVVPNTYRATTPLRFHPLVCRYHKLGRYITPFQCVAVCERWILFCKN